MGKYDDSLEENISLEDVGITQLEDAITLFLEEKHLSSITLAGTADGIFSDLIKTQGKKNLAEETWAAVEKNRERSNYKVPINPLTGEEYSKSEAFQFWNGTRNKLKHHSSKKDGAFPNINLVDDSYEWLLRTIASANAIGLEPKNLFDFQNNTIPRFHMSWHFLNTKAPLWYFHQSGMSSPRDKGEFASRKLGATFRGNRFSAFKRGAERPF